MTSEDQNPPKGHVEFHQPAVKLVADMPEDGEIRAHLDEMKASDGYPGSCGTCEEEK
ncbi:hypothetical protein [Paenibacillus aceris]|uniref:CxxH/CxxC protein n=1 Tax=Paenibacillus aceris TaxID=869555 RepID=A0ABS4I3Q7_9BACL|nr:hypothetical protein [Paenibacillus aceris]MBP1965554.1 hypothetical protein [Paenibacillus aceris]NHW38505.1 hypothetical protein [Paenibacillus aceris]